MKKTTNETAPKSFVEMYPNLTSGQLVDIIKLLQNNLTIELKALDCPTSCSGGLSRYIKAVISFDGTEICESTVSLPEEWDL